MDNQQSLSLSISLSDQPRTLTWVLWDALQLSYLRVVFKLNTYLSFAFEEQHPKFFNLAGVITW